MASHFFSLLSYAGQTIRMGMEQQQPAQYFGWRHLSLNNFLVFRPNGLKYGWWVTHGTGFDILVNFSHFGDFDPILGVKNPKWGKNGQFLTFRDFRPNWGGRSYAF